MTGTGDGSTGAWPTADSGAEGAWWRTGLLYQVYVRSFADSNGDGVGDLRGLIDHLDHLSWLGVDGLWLSPVNPSPNADWGYDVADYCAVDPQYGTLADLDELVRSANGLGIQVLIDLVPNHTSDQHPWFIESKSSKTAGRRDFYVWVDPKPDGSPPNNWVGCFGGPAWTFDDTTRQYYLHNFLPEQPDLNWWCGDVRTAFEDIIRFWWDRGIAGFRIDVCNMIIKDARLRDNPPATEHDPFIMQIFGQRPEYTSNQPEVHDVLKHWRRLAQAYDPPRVLLGETNVESLETLARFYGSGDDELSLSFNFPFLESPFQAGPLRAIVERTEELLPPGAWPVWTGSNHDVSRLATRWAAGEHRKVRMALLMLLTLRGTPVLYQGDEIGLTDGVLSHEEILDPVGLRFWPAYQGRDPERTPMPWSAGANGGFTDPGSTPWLRMGDPTFGSVADQRGDPQSILQFVRAVVAFRRRSPDLLSGDYRSLQSPDPVWAWRRGSSTVIALNLSANPAQLVLATPAHDLALSTDPTMTTGPRQGHLVLPPWEGAIVLEPR
ncbi:MAG TPA: alpha-amylase family glycosyl hydrolase [Acidimicrobiales bacterium]|nr:alpha-amylase family glycosyl hydrolase [Acidimicrobiales bacterium]